MVHFQYEVHLEFIRVTDAGGATPSVSCWPLAVSELLSTEQSPAILCSATESTIKNGGSLKPQSILQLSLQPKPIGWELQKRASLGLRDKGTEVSRNFKSHCPVLY